MWNKNVAVIIDGNSLTYRAYYATIKQLDYFKLKNIKPNNAIKLMLMMSLKILSEHQPQYALIAFDAGKKTFRNELFSDYKANRASTPIELINQLKDLQNLLMLIGYQVRLQEGIEADDIIGSFAKLANEAKLQCKIFSSDKDMLQLVNNHTTVYQPKVGISEMQTYNLNNFAKLCDGLLPEQITEYKGIVGDSSDNLPGIKGIGKKTGLDLLLKYRDLDGIYEHLDELKPKQKELFLEYKSVAQQCKMLATIKTDLFTNDNVNNFLRQPMQLEAIFEYLKTVNINNLDRYIFEANK